MTAPYKIDTNQLQERVEIALCRGAGVGEQAFPALYSRQRPG